MFESRQSLMVSWFIIVPLVQQLRGRLDGWSGWLLSLARLADSRLANSFLEISETLN